MKKFMYLAPLIGLLATSCVTDKPDVIADDAGQLHYTTPYQDDTRGQKVFPATWNVKGKKLFVFDPNADAWAAYDAQGNRVMTGSASGGMDRCPDADESCRTVVGTFAVFNKKGLIVNPMNILLHVMVM